MVKTILGNLPAVKQRSCTNRKQQFRAKLLHKKIAAFVRNKIHDEINTTGIHNYILKHKLDPSDKNSLLNEQSKQDTVTVHHNNRQSNSDHKCTVSLAIPAAIIDNAQSFELKTYLVSQIARAAAIYKVDELVIINSRGKHSSSLAKSDPTEFFVRNLEYLETPPYLRKALFPVCPELKYSGLMNPLDIPHHFRADEWSQFREGVVVSRPIKAGKGSWVNSGLKKDCQVDLHIEEGKWLC